MNRDTLIGILGASILITAMVGVFYYERNVADTAGIGSPDGPTGTMGAAGPTVEGTVAVGKSDNKIANITSTSATNVTFHLTWKATNGKDTLKLTVAPPTGSGILEGALSEPSDSGDVTVTVMVPAGANPTGGWEVTVEFTKATPAALPGGIPPPTPPPNSTDASVAYKVAVTIA